MGDLIIKFKKTYYPKDSDIRNLLKYIAGQGKKDNQKIIYLDAKGLSLDCKEAADQIIKLQTSLDKNKERRAYHLVVSFPGKVKNNDMVIVLGDYIADRIWKDGYQVFYSVHGSTDNKHIHFAINAVGYRTGHKWHMSNGELRRFKDSIQNMWVCLIESGSITFWPY